MNKIFDVPMYPYARHADQDAPAPVRHKVIVIGAGPIGLAAAIDLAQQGIEVVVLDDNDKVSFGSRAICFAKRTLEIADRLGCGQPMVDKGVLWNVGKVFFDDRQVYDFNLLPEEGHQRPAFINLQQYYFEEYMVNRVRELQAQGAPIEIRGRNKVSAIGTHPDHVTIEIDTPEGSYNLEADWMIACDGAASPTRMMLGKDFVGRVFEDNFLIADVVMEADFPTERWFWFDPPFNKGQSALLLKQPDGVWRIDLQLGWDIDKEPEKRPENVIPRLKAMLGDDVEFELESLFPGVPSFSTDKNAELIQLAEKLTNHQAHAVAFATEAPFLQQLGMETVVLGPGSIDQAHQLDEFISLDQLIPTVELLSEFINTFCLKKS